MDILDRLLGHDIWTTRQLLSACEALPTELLDQEFDIDHKSLRATFVHMIENTEIWTDLLYERPVQEKTGDSIAELQSRLGMVGRDFANLARNIARENRYDDCFMDTLDNPPRKKLLVAPLVM